MNYQLQYMSSPVIINMRGEGFFPSPFVKNPGKKPSQNELSSGNWTLYSYTQMKSNAKVL